MPKVLQLDEVHNHRLNLIVCKSNLLRRVGAGEPVVSSDHNFDEIGVGRCVSVALVRVVRSVLSGHTSWRSLCENEREPIIDSKFQPVCD